MYPSEAEENEDKDVRTGLVMGGVLATFIVAMLALM